MPPHLLSAYCRNSFCPLTTKASEPLTSQLYFFSSAKDIFKKRLANDYFFFLRMVFVQDLDMVAVIDLHTAPGSQNGFDNSGRTGDPHWVEWGQVSGQFCIKNYYGGYFSYDRAILKTSSWSTMDRGVSTVFNDKNVR